MNQSVRLGYYIFEYYLYIFQLNARMSLPINIMDHFRFCKINTS